MSFKNYLFGPNLYKEYADGPSNKLYEAAGLEKIGDQIISTLSMMWNLSYYTSPLLLSILYRRGYFVAESITSLAKFTTTIGLILIISLCMRGLGRQKSPSYVKLVKALENLNSSSNKTSDEENKKQLGLFDFDFKYWPVDFDVTDNGEKNKRSQIIRKSQRPKSFWISTLPCELAAFVAIHTFGIKLIYPGSVKLLQRYFTPMLIQGRSKLIEEDKGRRYKVKTIDNNDIDTFFIDNRKKSPNGNILVICSEGNAGFYEIGIMSTPLTLKYSVLGWNHPGFGGSTGKPFPDQDQNAIDAVIQFAINKLNFIPERIILFGWSIGAYTSLWAATQYPDIKGIVLDATFDDILYLAIPRMPPSLTGIVKIAIRDYVNLHNSELINYFPGPVLMIRRTDDEIICTEENRIETNRGNYLLLSFLKFRYPNIFKGPQMNYAKTLISKPIDNLLTNEDYCLSLLTSYVSDNSKSFPMLIGEEFNDEQRQQMVDYLISKHFRDFNSTHCNPLPSEFFSIPWDIPVEENDFVFT